MSLFILERLYLLVLEEARLVNNISVHLHLCKKILPYQKLEVLNIRLLQLIRMDFCPLVLSFDVDCVV